MADTKLSGMTERGAAVVDADLFYTVSGSTSYKLLASRVKTYCSDSPTLVTPNIGTPSAGTLTNCTGLPVGGISATGTPDNTTYLRGDGSWQTVSAGATPGGSDTQVQFNDGGSALGGDAGLTYNKTTNVLTNTGGQLSLAGETVTTSTPVLTATQTWNDGAVTFTGLKFNVTNTASAAASMLIDLQVGGSSKASINRTGEFKQVTYGSGDSPTLAFYDNGTSGFWSDSNGAVYLGGSSRGTQFVYAPNGLFHIGYDGALTFGTGAASASGGDVIIRRDAANVLAQRNSTTAQTFRVYNTYTDSSNYERGFMRWASDILEIGSEAGGTGTARRIVLKSAAGQITVGSAECDDGYFNLYESTATAEARTLASRSFIFNTGDAAYVHARASTYYGWTAAATNADVGTTPDTMLTRVAAGIVGVRAGSSSAGGAIGLVEQTAPSAPSANGVYIYAEDNGAGKTRLMAIFGSGAAQQIAIEP